MLIIQCSSGREAQISRGQAIAPNPAMQFDPIIHLDLKADNSW